MAKIKLIIFDFDGVVVDSEHLSSAIHAQTLQQVGIGLTEQDIDNQYTGTDFPTMIKQLSHDFGHSKAALFANRIEANYLLKMQNELQLMPHILEFLFNTNLKFCIASNSKMSRLNNNLSATKINNLFAEKIFSADMVKHPKPAPDLFLYAAKQMGIATENCLVIEDGTHGIKAANEAGIRAIGFYGGTHCKGGHDTKLQNAGALHVFANINQLTDIIKDIDDGKY